MYMTRHMTRPCFCSQVYGQTSRICRQLLHSEDEVFFIIRSILERNSLRSHEGSFSENLYGLKRSPAAGGSELTTSQRNLSVIYLTLKPFLRVKMIKLYRQCSGDDREAHLNGARKSIRELFAEKKFGQLTSRVFAVVYPYMQVSTDMVFFMYQIMYFLGKTPYYTPDLHILGLKVARLSANDRARIASAMARHRSERLCAISKSNSYRLVKIWKLMSAHAQHALSDHSRTALILAVFGFKVCALLFCRFHELLILNSVFIYASDSRVVVYDS